MNAKWAGPYRRTLLFPSPILACSRDVPDIARQGRRQPSFIFSTAHARNSRLARDVTPAKEACPRQGASAARRSAEKVLWARKAIPHSPYWVPSGVVATAARGGSKALAVPLIGVMMPHVFDWILPEQLGACVNPYVSQSAVNELQTNGISVLVNLHERPDADDILAQLQARAVHLPVPDSHAPTQHQLDEGVAAIENALKEGQPVAVHCGAGP